MDASPAPSCNSSVSTGNRRELPIWGTFLSIFQTSRGHNTSRRPLTRLTTAQKRRQPWLIYLSLFCVFPWMMFSYGVYLMRLDTNRCVHWDVFHWSVRCVYQHLTLRINKKGFNNSRKQFYNGNKIAVPSNWLSMCYIYYALLHLQTRFP